MELNRYRRKRSKVNASIFDLALRSVLNVFACGQVSPVSVNSNLIIINEKKLKKISEIFLGIFFDQFLGNVQLGLEVAISLLKFLNLMLRCDQNLLL